MLPFELSPRALSSFSLTFENFARYHCSLAVAPRPVRQAFSQAGPRLQGTELGTILADATVPPPSLFGSLAPGIVSFVEAASNMAQPRTTTPARGTTPARALNPVADRQRGTTPSATVGHKPIIASVNNSMNVSNVNESRQRLVGGVSVSFPASRHA